MSQLPYDAARVLAELRTEIGLSSFGLVVQALFAHVLVRLGANVLDIKNPGHPDISVILGGQLHNIEVEAATRKSITRRLQSGDLEVLQCRGEGEYGFFCVLDCGPPAVWLCVDVAALGNRANEDLHLSLLRAYSDHDYSNDCTALFSELVVREAQHLPHLSFAQLRKEALDGKCR
jgi:hypothetical protein